MRDQADSKGAGRGGDCPLLSQMRGLSFCHFQRGHEHHAAVLLIQQYGRARNVLVAGYISKGENAEHAVVREIQEEMGMRVTQMAFVKSTYFEPSNTLMLHYLTVVDSEDLSGRTPEVDKAQWFSLEEAKREVVTPSLAQRFLWEALGRLERREIVLLPVNTDNLWPVENP